MILRIGLFALLLTPTLASAANCPSPWSRTLRMGSAGVDVKALQIYLNKSPTTRIADFGPGSPGEESTTFGKATARAVVKFQTEQDLTASGLFGPITRERLTNERVCAAATSSGAIQATNTPQVKVTEKTLALESLHSAARESIEKSSDLMTKFGYPVSDFSNLAKKVILAAPAPRAILPGSTVTLRGMGFAEASYVTLGNQKISVSRLDNYSGTIAIPGNTSSGLYDLTLNSNGNRSEVQRIAILEKDKTAPAISKFDPATGNVGTSVTLTGTGFAETNDIDTSAGVITGVSSDGKTIRFTLRGDPILVDVNGTLLKSLPMTIRVVNKYGVSNSIKLTLN